MNTKQLLGITAGLMLGAGMATAQVGETNVTFTANQAIPDANVNGLTLFGNVAMPLGLNTVSSLTVSLDITGGFNGDLYGYLAGPGGGFAVLLNRAGVSNGPSAFGYSDAGYNVTFSDAAANGDVHFYQNVSNPGGGQLNGTWQPDGRTINPTTNNPAAFFTAGRPALLSSFQGSNANGTWTLFLADLGAGGQGTVVNWTLDITSVPEPGVWVIGFMGMMVLVGCKGSGWRKRA